MGEPRRFAALLTSAAEPECFTRDQLSNGLTLRPDFGRWMCLLVGLASLLGSRAVRDTAPDDPPGSVGGGDGVRRPAAGPTGAFLRFAEGLVAGPLAAT